MILEIIIGMLIVYCISLNVKINRLKYPAKYGSPKCEQNISTLWKHDQEQQEKLSELSSRVRDLENQAGMHKPHVTL
ncbi:MAG: hypothetical protein K6L74_00355 [Neptuniibacter sp.]